jgi:hypothetical protein
MSVRKCGKAYHPMRHERTQSLGTCSGPDHGISTWNSQGTLSLFLPFSPPSPKVEEEKDEEKSNY